MWCGCFSLPPSIGGVQARSFPPRIKVSAFELIQKALSCRCPRCGKGFLFSGFLKVVEACSACGLPLAKNDNGDGPAVFLIFILGAVLVPIALVIALRVDWPLWVHGFLWGALILGSTLGLLRPAKALTMALQFRHRPEAFTDDKQP